ncbi:KdsC family phosphatase [Alcaligenes sp. WGS1538]|uniref:KdsC family phosphatase n=1 Tax=Alcaligenes sp. WGS1538 TaxID=3366811 RepID=UPI00372CE90A
MLNNPTAPLHPAEAQILAKLPETTRERLRALRMMVFDVDGVLTDGRLWYSEQGEVFKGFHALDGHGLRMLGESGISVAIITGRESGIVARRAAELGIRFVHQGVGDKVAILSQIAQENGLALNELGYMGDDLIDLAAMQRVGFSASVPNAPFYVSQMASWVSTLPAGQGAVRECCDAILAAQGRLATFITGGLLKTTGVIQ